VWGGGGGGVIKERGKTLQIWREIEKSRQKTCYTQKGRGKKERERTAGCKKSVKGEGR